MDYLKGNNFYIVVGVVVVGILYYLYTNNYFSSKKEKKVNPKISELKKALNATENFYSLCGAAFELESNVSDLRVSQFGINTKNKLVILDYGFGNAAFSYYNNVYRLADEADRRETFMGDHDEEPTEDEYGHPIKRTYQTHQKDINRTPDNDDIPF